jgi:hypothetical protein
MLGRLSAGRRGSASRSLGWFQACVARELGTRWNTALELVAYVEDRIARHDAAVALRPKVDRAALMTCGPIGPKTYCNTCHGRRIFRPASTCRSQLASRSSR